jgi:prevent-host-death family protein
MKEPWPLQDAKARLSDLVTQAQNGEVQIITKWGEPAVAVVSMQIFEALQGSEQSAWEAMRDYRDPSISAKSVDKLFKRKPSRWRSI